MKKFNSEDLEIREMVFEDLKDVFFLGEELFTSEQSLNLYRTWDEFELLERFISDGEYCFTAIYKNKIIGFAIGTLIDKRNNPWIYGYLIWFGINPKFQGLGIGRKMLNKMTRLFIKNGARIMMVDTAKDNEEALNFFRKRGFGNESDHVFLIKNLTKLPAYLKKKNR